MRLLIWLNQNCPRWLCSHQRVFVDNGEVMDLYVPIWMVPLFRWQMRTMGAVATRDEKTQG